MEHRSLHQGQTDRPAPDTAARVAGPANDRLGAVSAVLNAAPPVQRLARMAPAAASDGVAQLTKGTDTKTKAKKVKKPVWNKARVKLYQTHLRNRMAHRLRRGKTKTANKLVRKLRNARLLGKLKDFTLADPPKSGHHVPPLALSNKMGSDYAYGKRESKEEKEKERLYLKGDKGDRELAHGTMHASEAMVGLDRSKGFGGDDDDLVKRHLLAHTGLTYGGSGKKIKAAKQSKVDRNNDVDLDDFEELGTITPKLYRSHGASKKSTKMDIEEDDTDSEVDEEFENHYSDSDHSDSEEESEEDN